MYKIEHRETFEGKMTNFSWRLHLIHKQFLLNHSNSHLAHNLYDVHFNLVITFILITSIPYWLTFSISPTNLAWTTSCDIFQCTTQFYHNYHRLLTENILFILFCHSNSKVKFIQEDVIHEWNLNKQIKKDVKMIKFKEIQ